VVMWCIP